MVQQALGDPLVHKYTSIILAVASVIENISGLIESILAILGLSTTATFGQSFLYLGPTIYYGLQIPINTTLAVLNWLAVPTDPVMQVYTFWASIVATVVAPVSFIGLSVVSLLYAIFFDTTAAASLNDQALIREGFRKFISIAINGGAAVESLLFSLSY